MSEIKIVVREANRDWSGTMHGSDADRAIAALSADPVTLDELQAATARFAKPSAGRRFFANLSRGLNDEPYDAGLIVIDLAAHIVFIDSTYSYAGLTGDVRYWTDHACKEVYVTYHVADDWEFFGPETNWKHRAEVRRKEQAARPMIDARAVFYGRPMLEFVARGCFAAFARRDQIASATRAKWAEQTRQRLAKEAGISPDQVDAALLTEAEITPKHWTGEVEESDLYADAIREIHAAWLLTPRDDLGGACPREIALEHHGHIDWDNQDRCQQWSIMQACPPALDKSTHAYQYGGFGTHELVEYYELVREILWCCWDDLAEIAQSANARNRPESMLVGDFLTTEVPRLEAVCEAFLDGPNEEFHGRSPRSIIENERLRLPEAMSGKDAVIDSDCPCCQMMADMPGPMFWHLDGCNMDDDFAFDISHRTREEWEEEQREWEEHRRRFDAEEAEMKRLGVEGSIYCEPAPNSVWSRSFSIGETADVPLGVRVFGLGCRLAELIVGLRGCADRDNVASAAQQHIDRLNRGFGNFRELLQTADTSLAAALVEPVLARFAETLDAVSVDHPELEPKCQALADDLEKLLNPPSPPGTWEGNHDDIPF